jgi:hypothetical protein
MAAQELPKFCERENSKLFAFYSLNRNKNTMTKKHFLGAQQLFRGQQIFFLNI